jgi:glycogen debranching enzyme
MNAQAGPHWVKGGARFVVHAASATQVWLCLFNKAGEETRLAMQAEGGMHHVTVSGVKAGQRYGFRADGPWDPDAGQFHDPAKLLADPRATRFDSAWKHDARLAASRADAIDTAGLVPKCVLEKVAISKPPPPLHKPGGLIYEVNVRSFTMMHPDVPAADRGTARALAHPAVIAHLRKIGVGAIELMPVTAWIDERHLPPLGLGNAWGYNPVVPMAVDPRLCPGGIADLRFAVEALRAAGIGVLLDLVFNHTGESDRFGPVISFRGLDNHVAYRHVPGEPGHLINDAGTGNTLRCDHPVMRDLIIDSLRHFVLAAGVDGFRFDLAPILGRSDSGFSPHAALLHDMQRDEALADRVLIAEPWDIGPGGYQLGNFPPRFEEWNDRARDDMRCFWRGDAWKIGAFATRIAGSSDIFGRDGAQRTRSVNFIAAHDGFTLADMVSHHSKHNEANGEDNRDGHNDNHSWNNGAEGASDDPEINARRRADCKALLSTLFASRGSILLTAGDEFGRTQHGNNNAYAQDNARFWVDWAVRDHDLEDHAAALAELRARSPLGRTEFLSGAIRDDGRRDAAWLSHHGTDLSSAEWEAPETGLFTLVLDDLASPRSARLAILFNRTHRSARFVLPEARWRDALQTGQGLMRGDAFEAPPRSVSFFEEVQE